MSAKEQTEAPAAARPSPSLLLTGLFLFFAAYVNLNDPDAFFWTPAYGFGGVLSWLCLQKPHLLDIPAPAASRNKQESSSSTTVALVRNLYKTYLIMSLAVAAASFSLLRSEAAANVSGKSGWLGVFELEPVREGGGALIMALSMYLCLSWPAQQQSAESSMSSLILTTTSGVVAAVAIYLGVILPQYYTRLGVTIPEHCGGGGEEGQADNPLLLNT